MRSLPQLEQEILQLPVEHKNFIDTNVSKQSRSIISHFTSNTFLPARGF
jgi:hypothetical protein